MIVVFEGFIARKKACLVSNCVSNRAREARTLFSSIDSSEWCGSLWRCDWSLQAITSESDCLGAKVTLKKNIKRVIKVIQIKLKFVEQKPCCLRIRVQ